jgi:hypothetical protein
MMKTLILALLLTVPWVAGDLAIAGPKAKPSPTPTPPTVTGETYYRWLNDYAHWIETHPPTPDQ